MPPGTVVTQIMARDEDSSKSANGIVIFKLEDAPPSLAIDSQDGTIYTTNNLDYETNSVLHARVIAQNIGSIPLSSTSLLTVNIKDVKDELTSRLFEKEEYTVSCNPILICINLL